MNIGSHIPSKNAVEEIKLRKGDTFQIFVSSPQMWKSPKPREDIDVLQEYKGPYICACPIFNQRSNTKQQSKTSQ
jgi:endonuclease IV